MQQNTESRPAAKRKATRPCGKAAKSSKPRKEMEFVGKFDTPAQLLAMLAALPQKIFASQNHNTKADKAEE